jgi:hypothetical protein
MSSQTAVEHLVHALHDAAQASMTNGVDPHHELTPEQASRMAVTAVTSDLQFWSCTASVDGRVGLHDLTRTLDVIRQASTPEI